MISFTTREWDNDKTGCVLIIPPIPPFGWGSHQMTDFSEQSLVPQFTRRADALISAMRRAKHPGANPHLRLRRHTRRLPQSVQHQSVAAIPNGPHRNVTALRTLSEKSRSRPPRKNVSLRLTRSQRRWRLHDRQRCRVSSRRWLITGWGGSCTVAPRRKQGWQCNCHPNMAGDPQRQFTASRVPSCRAWRQGTCGCVRGSARRSAPDRPLPNRNRRR